MFPKLNKQAFKRLAQSVKEVQDFERSLGLEDDPRYDYEPVDIDAKFIQAVEYEDFNNIKKWLDAGADIHAMTDYALRWASLYGYVEVVKVLLENGANIHAENDGALRWASKEGHVEVVKVLLESGANVNANNDGVLGWAGEDDGALLLASSNGHVEVVKLLLEAGAKIDKEIYKSAPPKIKAVFRESGLI